MLTDRSLRKSSAHKELLVYAGKVTTNVLHRLNPPPASAPHPRVPALDLSLDGGNGVEAVPREGSAEADGGDDVLSQVPLEKRPETQQAIEDAIASMMFVELLFPKGPREVEVVNADYHWRRVRFFVLFITSTASVHISSPFVRKRLLFTRCVNY